MKSRPVRSVRFVLCQVQQFRDNLGAILVETEKGKQEVDFSVRQNVRVNYGPYNIGTTLINISRLLVSILRFYLTSYLSKSVNGFRIRFAQCNGNFKEQTKIIKRIYFKQTISVYLSRVIFSLLWQSIGHSLVLQRTHPSPLFQSPLVHINLLLL